MHRDLLQQAVQQIKCELEQAITTASYRGQNLENGWKAKESLIRSGTLIQHLHEIAKISLDTELTVKNLAHKVHPPLGQAKPEIHVWGLLKKKK